MALIKRKTKKALTKQVNKLIRKHGTEIAVGLVSNLMTGIAAATVAKEDDDDTASKKRAKNGKSKKKKAKKRARVEEDEQTQDGNDENQDE